MYLIGQKKAMVLLWCLCVIQKTFQSYSSFLFFHVRFFLENPDTGKNTDLFISIILKTILITSGIKDHGVWLQILFAVSTYNIYLGLFH
jgi:hypothetical protein